MRRWLERLFNPTGTSAAPRREPAGSRFQFGDDESMCPPQTVSDPAAWDEFWRRRFEIGFGPAECHIFAQPAEIAQVLAANNLRSILCVGSGPSHEPWAFARAGYDVTVLDLSSYTVQKARESMPALYDTIRFVTGSLMDANLCLGPLGCHTGTTDAAAVSTGPAPCRNDGRCKPPRDAWPLLQSLPRRRLETSCQSAPRHAILVRRAGLAPLQATGDSDGPHGMDVRQHWVETAAMRLARRPERFAETEATGESRTC